MLLHGKVVWLGCTVFLMAALVPAFAQTESAVAGTPALVTTACSTLHTSVARSLSSAKKTTAQSYCQQAQKHAYKVQFWLKKPNSWTLYRRGINRRLTCEELHMHHRLQGPEALCFRARQDVRIHLRKLLKLNAKIERLATPQIWLADLASSAVRRACIARTESSGYANPYVISGGGGGHYYGKYQYDEGSWQKAVKKANSYYHLDLPLTTRANQASPWEQEVVTAFAVTHPDVLTWDPWQECR